jgi:hypothetical protein
MIDLNHLSSLPNLTPWEKTFLSDLIERKEKRGDEFVLSDKQTAILAKIEKDRTPK